MLPLFIRGCTGCLFRCPIPILLLPPPSLLPGDCRRVWRVLAAVVAEVRLVRNDSSGDGRRAVGFCRGGVGGWAVKLARRPAGWMALPERAAAAFFDFPLPASWSCVLSDLSLSRLLSRRPMPRSFGLAPRREPSAPLELAPLSVFFLDRRMVLCRRFSICRITTYRQNSDTRIYSRIYSRSSACTGSTMASMRPSCMRPLAELAGY